MIGNRTAIVSAQPTNPKKPTIKRMVWFRIAPSPQNYFAPQLLDAQHLDAQYVVIYSTFLVAQRTKATGPTSHSVSKLCELR